jgi:hypothetical protein
MNPGWAATEQTATVAASDAAAQLCGMATRLPISKRGSLTLPPALRRKMGPDKMPNQMVVVEKREGGLFLRPAIALPIREIPKKQIEEWIARDEAEMAAVRAKPAKSRI